MPKRDDAPLETALKSLQAPPKGRRPPDLHLLTHGAAVSRTQLSELQALALLFLESL